MNYDNEQFQEHRDRILDAITKQFEVRWNTILNASCTVQADTFTIDCINPMMDPLDAALADFESKVDALVQASIEGRKDGE